MTDHEADIATLHQEATQLRARIKRLEDENAQLRGAVGSDLSERMVAAGMVPPDMLTRPTEATRFMVHAGMTDLSFFGEWLERKAMEARKMQAAHQCGAHPLDEDLFQFVLGKSAAYSDTLENFRAALQESSQ